MCVCRLIFRVPGVAITYNRRHWQGLAHATWRGESAVEEFAFSFALFKEASSHLFFINWMDCLCFLVEVLPGACFPFLACFVEVCLEVRLVGQRYVMFSWVGGFCNVKLVKALRDENH